MIGWARRHRTMAVILAMALCIATYVVVRMAIGSRVEVEIATATRGPLSLHIAASGLVEGDGADLGFQASGRIVALYVREGQSVYRSQTLARALTVSQGFEVSDSVGTIQAPHDGTVVTIYQRAGAVVNPGQAVLRLVADGPPWVTAFIESEDAAHLVAGQKLSCRAGGYLSQSWELVVEKVGTEAVPRPDQPASSRQVRVRCSPVAAGFPLRPGTEVDIDGDAELAHEATLIPAAAVVRSGGQDSVWVVDGERARKRPVKLGPNNFSLIAVQEGVDPGDVAVVHGKEGITEGVRVTTRPMPPSAPATGGGE